MFTDLNEIIQKIIIIHVLLKMCRLLNYVIQQLWILFLYLFAVLNVTLHWKRYKCQNIQ